MNVTIGLPDDTLAALEGGEEAPHPLTQYGCTYFVYRLP
jgi:hypothetical protein